MNTNIRYVCLSDMHLGDESSLLTGLTPAGSSADPSRPSEVLVGLVRCLRHLIEQNEGGERPTLVLNGDILEFALATDENALMVFERFVELSFPRDGARLFDDIVYIPGNHDHHIWESARETQYVEYIGSPEVAKRPLLPPPWHATNLFSKGETDRKVVPYLLARVLKSRLGVDVPIEVRYPNHGVLSPDLRRCVIWSHGHFIEPLYLAASKLKTYLFPETSMPKLVWELEAENFAWIDFFWSMMGRQGDAGKRVSVVYKHLSDEQERRRLLDRLADSLAREYDIKNVPEPLERRTLRFAFHALQHLLLPERHVVEELGEAAQDGLRAYVSGPLREQILLENGGAMPPEVTFVFGHTHKPFERDWQFDGYPEWVDLYNTGGWVVESVAPERHHGGAVVLVSGDLETTSLHMYRESLDPDAQAVTVRQSSHAQKKHHAFHQRIAGLVDAKAEPWASFSEAVKRGLQARELILRPPPSPAA